MVTMAVSPEVRDKAAVMKENLGYDSIAEFLADAMTFVEDNMDDFDAAFPPEEEDTEDEDEK